MCLTFENAILCLPSLKLFIMYNQNWPGRLIRTLILLAFVFQILFPLFYLIIQNMLWIFPSPRRNWKRKVERFFFKKENLYLSSVSTSSLNRAFLFSVAFKIFSNFAICSSSEDCWSSPDSLLTFEFFYKIKNKKCNIKLLLLFERLVDHSQLLGCHCQKSLICYCYCYIIIIW